MPTSLVDPAIAPENLVFGALTLPLTENPFAQKDISTDQIEALYALALARYNAGNYADADTVFQSLCCYKNDDVRFWMGLGGCRQAMNHMLSAADAYCAAAYVGQFASPQPLLFMALCLLRGGLRREAACALHILLTLGEKPHQEDKECLEKARQLLTILDKNEDAD